MTTLKTFGARHKVTVLCRDDACDSILCLGLSLKEEASARQLACSSSSFGLSQGVLSVEEKLKVLNAVLVALEQLGFIWAEVFCICEMSSGA